VIAGPISVRAHADVATALLCWSTREDAQPARKGVITCAMVGQNGQWLIATLHNTDAR
jgi:hypothetical protein